MTAVARGDLPLVQSVLREGRASITTTDEDGYTALLGSMIYGHLSVALWLIEHGGASMTAVTNTGESVWDHLGIFWRRKSQETQARIAPALSALLRAMLVRGDPPPGYENQLSQSAESIELTQTVHEGVRQTVHEGVRLRARLPAYLAQRRALLDAHCPLLPPLRALVHGYEEPTTIEELWATGLGADPGPDASASTATQHLLFSARPCE